MRSLKQILKETNLLEYSYIIEGIDIDEKNRIVSFNSDHENKVDTSLLLNPTCSEINGHPILSVFKRKKIKHHQFDGNPLVYALKNTNGWKFKNPQRDIIGLLKQFIRITEKILPQYDTVITIPSNNPLNVIFLHRLNKIIKCNHQIKDYLFKLDASYVYENCIDWSELASDSGWKYGISQRQLNRDFKAMEINNDNIFSYKFLKNGSLGKYITQTFKAKDDKTIEYAPLINDKNVLVLDDTILDGGIISEACTIIMDTYVPKSLTAITLFSALDK